MGRWVCRWVGGIKFQFYCTHPLLPPLPPFFLLLIYSYRVMVAFTGVSCEWFQSQPITFVETDERQKTRKRREKLVHLCDLMQTKNKNQETQNQLTVGII